MSARDRRPQGRPAFAALAGIYPQADGYSMGLSGLAGSLPRSARPAGSCATQRSRSVTMGDNHAAIVSAGTYTNWSGPGAL